ncbi:MAG TPA: hypothetical protein VLZ74_07490 [Methylocella sp.]|nr:hypothetical protein [Methylocella sp.]
MQSDGLRSFNENQTLVSGTTEDLVSPPWSTREAHEGFKDTEAEIAFAVFNNVIERLERLLEKETAMLIQQQPIALEDFNYKKRHGLLELSRAMDSMRSIHYRIFAHDPRAALARLRVKLESNLTILQTHLDAVGAIASIIACAIQEQESDGTYTQLLGSKGRSR